MQEFLEASSVSQGDDVLEVLIQQLEEIKTNSNVSPIHGRFVCGSEDCVLKVLIWSLCGRQSIDIAGIIGLLSLMPCM